MKRFVFAVRGDAATLGSALVRLAFDARSLVNSVIVRSERAEFLPVGMSEAYEMSAE